MARLYSTAAACKPHIKLGLYTLVIRFTLIVVFSFCFAQVYSEDSMNPYRKMRLSPIFDNEKCFIQLGNDSKSFINLKPLIRTDGKPRFYTSFNSTNKKNLVEQWDYTFNPCMEYKLTNQGDREIFGDGCTSSILCKYQHGTQKYYYTLGTSDAEVDAWLYPDKSTRVRLIFKGEGSMRDSSIIVDLVCDRTKSALDSGEFNIKTDRTGSVHAELRHKCCCIGACNVTEKPETGKSLENGEDDKKMPGGEDMLVAIGTVIGLVMVVAFIAVLCYVKRTHIQFYSKLPGIHSGPGGQMSNGKNQDFRDYEPAAASSARRRMLPLLLDSNIEKTTVEMSQRLGGGVFGDTHIAKWREMTVAVKRLTVAIHRDQLTTEMMEVLKEEVFFLSRQRHRNIVCVLGLCLDGRLPFLLTEYIIGECLKDLIKTNGHLLTWPQRIRMCSQISDGMTFLHSKKPSIIHRDLRCGNLFLSENDMIKVADFGLTKLVQPIRENCDQDDCSCERQFSACPGTIRWTAPELLAHPRTREGDSSIISTSCDVYSFGLVMWELVTCKDPFEEINSPSEVIEVVKNGGRPEVSPNIEMMSQYSSLMKNCWDHRPSFRPPFKQIVSKLKELVGPARSFQKQLVSKQRSLSKLSESADIV